VCVLKDCSKPLALAYKKAEVAVLCAEPFELDEDTVDAELVLELTATVFEGLVMQEDDVGLRELLSRLASHPQVHFSHEADVKQLDLLAAND